MLILMIFNFSVAYNVEWVAICDLALTFMLTGSTD